MLAGATGGGRDDSLQAYPALTLMSRVGLALDPASLGLCWARSCLECIRTELDRSVLGGEQAGPRAGPLRPGLWPLTRSRLLYTYKGQVLAKSSGYNPEQNRKPLCPQGA